MNHLSPDELQDVFGAYQEWVKSMGANYLGGQRLEDNGALIQSTEGKIVTDGPFLESKEIIAGYFLVQAENQDAANAIALSSPHLGLYTIEVRPLAYPKMD